jgi:hypothetical protein
MSITVGITTCYGAESILDTVRSVRGSRGVGDFRFVIVADRVPLTLALKHSLADYNVELIENEDEGSQFTKQKQILAACTSDIIVFTQDDVLFEPYTLANIVQQFVREPQTTFVSIRNQPVQATSRFEAALNSGTAIANRIARRWRQGDNYLSVIGRCMAFRTSWLKKNMVLKDEVVSSDAYCYFENKRKGGVYRFLPQVAVLFKNPQNIHEHLRKSSRFQHSALEMSRYFGNLDQEYIIPKHLAVQAFFEELGKHPFATLMYCGIYLYTRCLKTKPAATLTPTWEVDLSTKKVTH